ncbi:MAG: polysaccharide deacetylase family protein [Bacteroidota bacterium]
MYFTRIPKLVQRMYPDMVWRMQEDKPRIYLTFDDGPCPKITAWVLEQLAAYQAKASFFVIGKNVQQHPGLAHAILDAGHTLGNHMHDHLHGWRTDTKSYLKNFLQAQQIIAEYTGCSTRLFRPPYGRMTQAQRYHIDRSHRILMMDVISGDFDRKRNGKQCFETVKRHSRSGSILLFHDSEKAWPRLKEALPQTLAYFSEKGYEFLALPDKELKPLDAPELPLGVH